MRRALSLAPLASLPLLSLLSCGESPPATDASKFKPLTRDVASLPSPPPSGPVALGPGVDKSALDESVDACDDFYQHACGGWIKATQIPGDEARWFRSFSVIRDRNEEILKGILEGYAKGEGANEPNAKTLGDFYASCMDEPGIEKAATKPVEPWLKQIAAVRDVASLTKVIGKLHVDGMPTVFELSSAQDFGDATQTVGMIWQGGLGMPEREYYLEDSPKMKELRGKYEEHVAAMMKLAGEPEAKAKASARTVLTIETDLAKAWMTKEDRREPKKINHRATRDELAKVAPGIRWDAWLDGAGAKSVPVFNVAQPDYMKALGERLAKAPLADWKTYLRWHVYRRQASSLPQRFVDEAQKWQGALTGTQKLPDRWKRCVRTVDHLVGEALAQPFVKKTLGNEGKSTVVGMVQLIEQTMHENLTALAWMDEETRKAAFVKLSKIANKIAFPDKWRSYDGLEIQRGTYLANVARGRAFEHARQLAKMGKPVDRAEWLMSPPTVYAYYEPQLNEMVFPAGILQPPFYANAVPLATNYGGIGMVMGHELTHGFDDEGRQFDADGNLKDWWAKSVNAEFERRAECVKKQFDDYVVLGDVHVNGKLTLGENIADLGGVKLSFRAMKAAVSDHGKKPVSKTDERAFFYGFAQGWCGKMRDEALRHQVATNSHSPAHLRVNGPLSNLPEFAAAFDCGAKAKMVRKDRCEVW